MNGDDGGFSGAVELSVNFFDFSDIRQLSHFSVVGKLILVNGFLIIDKGKI